MIVTSVKILSYTLVIHLAKHPGFRSLPDELGVYV